MLQRAKAYNPVALVDFTVRVMEDYYRGRLRDFANGRVSAQRLLLDKLIVKASYLVSVDQMTDYSDNRFGVRNSDGTELYVVDASIGCCSCMAGVHGKFCKHQLAVMRLFQTAFPNVPGVTALHRHTIAYLALGEGCPPLEFYSDLMDADHSQSTTAMVMSNLLMTSNTNDQRQIDILRPAADISTGDNTDVDSTDMDYNTDAGNNVNHQSQQHSGRVQEYVQLVAVKLDAFRKGQLCDVALGKAIARLRAVSSESSLAAFLHNPGFYRRYLAGSTIRVQPTAVSRRRPHVTRGSKRLASGRPPLGSGQVPRKKRPHCLAHNISVNLPNAKSHH